MPQFFLAAITSGPSSVTPADAFESSIIGWLIITGGPLAVVAILFGWVIWKGALVPAKDRDAWRKAYEDERTAHATTRESLAVANDRAEAAVEAARVTTKLLEVVQQQQRHAD